jgi:hypothetical protein
MKTSLEEIKAKITPVLKQHDVIHAAIFGSLSRGELKEESDLDILIEFAGKKSLLDLVALKQELEEALERPVDVVTYNALHPQIRRRALKERVEIL